MLSLPSPPGDPDAMDSGTSLFGRTVDLLCLGPRLLFSRSSSTRGSDSGSGHVDWTMKLDHSTSAQYKL